MSKEGEVNVGIEIVSMLHAGFRCGPSEEDVNQAQEFYGGLLGLEIDQKRPEIPGIPGFWTNLKPGDRSQQLHVMGASGASPVARSNQEDPTRVHLAFAVKDLASARDELQKKKIKFWEYKALVGNASTQIFFEDPFGNVIEIQQTKN